MFNFPIIFVNTFYAYFNPLTTTFPYFKKKYYCYFTLILDVWGIPTLGVYFQIGHSAMLVYSINLTHTNSLRKLHDLCLAYMPENVNAKFSKVSRRKINTPKIT